MLGVIVALECPVCLQLNGTQNEQHNITLNSNTIPKTTRFYSLLSADDSNQYEIFAAKILVNKLFQPVVPVTYFPSNRNQVNKN